MRQPIPYSTRDTNTDSISRMLRDTEFFKSRISKIDGAGDIGDHLINFVHVKAVTEQPKPPKEPPSKTDEPAEDQQEANVEEKE